ncbi:hypothetical protein BGAL_0455g00050 [Botrytis galanthina]|uniref:Uncharacterized protein n=1 Tax=Botrytis galanthina TaxID=278940 RepID=A0A4S8QVZ8_9HELO|nr:hypothetical protein BGAL_0455g00050 [Botrytis galanthina]
MWVGMQPLYVLLRQLLMFSSLGGRWQALDLLEYKQALPSSSPNVFRYASDRHGTALFEVSS